MAQPLPDGIGSNKELVDAQSHLWNLVLSYLHSSALNCALQLHIPDIILKHAKPITLSELTQSLALPQPKSTCVHRLMRFLVHSKLFALDDDGAYSLTPTSRLLCTNQPLTLQPYALLHLDPTIMSAPGECMGRWFRNDDPTPFVTAHGEPLWKTLEDPRWNEMFNEAMSCNSQVVTRVIVEDCKGIFEELESMVDVGGGTGTVTKSIADAFPGLNCIVLDLPHVVRGLKGDPNLRFVGGDMFKSIPSAHAVFLKTVLHDWGDEECIQILKKCKEAINPSRGKGGKVIIVEIVMGEEGETNSEAMESQLLFDKLMMTLTTGKERSEQDWANLFHQAGFSTYNITPISKLKSLIQVFP